MRKSNVQPLQAISPTIDYKEFYSSYHKRKRQLLFLNGRNLPLIRTNVNYLSIDNNNAKRIIDVGTLTSGLSCISIIFR